MPRLPISDLVAVPVLDLILGLDAMIAAIII